jgi:DNA modification methylase
MYQENVMVPMGDWKNSRLKNLSVTDKQRDNSKVGSGFGKKILNWVNRELAYPTNVLRLATECGNKNHSAAFPVDLPSWFIKLFTKPGDVILDPFMGSGTTAVACINHNRHYCGFEINPEYIDVANSRISKPVIYLSPKENIKLNKRRQDDTNNIRPRKINQTEFREFL